MDGPLTLPTDPIDLVAQMKVGGRVGQTPGPVKGAESAVDDSFCNGNVNVSSQKSCEKPVKTETSRKVKSNQNDS